MASGALLVAALLFLLPKSGQAADCSTTVSSVSAAASAVDDAQPGATICLADGTYGKLTLNATKAAPGVTVRAQNPGKATIAGAQLSGSYLTVAQFRMTGTFEPTPGSTGMTADHNLFVGGNYYAVMAAATTTTTVNDVSITNNRFDGRFDEDAIRLNRYHDGPDADPYGVLIEGNEFSGNVEYGGHNDVLQSVWVGDHLYFRRNYLHDFGGQGFFVKDQASAIDGLVVEDNLIVRQDLPCDPTSLCPTWQLSPFQIFGPIVGASIRHNTVWPGPQGGQSWIRGAGWVNTVFSDNVMQDLNSDAVGLTLLSTSTNNTRCGGSGFPTTGVGSDCNPPFIDPANGDYRQPNGRGVTWRVADQHFGPTDAAGGTDPGGGGGDGGTGGGDGGTTPPPADTTAPKTTITAAPPATTTDDHVTVSFTVDDADATSQCSVDAGAWVDCTSPYEVTDLQPGEHAIVVRSTDAADNVESPGASAAWTVQAPPDDGGGGTEPPPGDAPPTVRLTAPSAGTYVTGGVRATATAADDHGVDHVEFWVDGTRVDSDTGSPYTTWISDAELDPGTRTITARAFDAAGQAASEAVTVRVSSWRSRRSARLSTTQVSDGVQRLVGSTAGNGVVRVTLTPCDSADGTVSDSFSLTADDQGRLDATYAGTGQCVLRLEPVRT